LQSIFGCSLGFSDSGASDAVTAYRRAFHRATVSWLDKNLQNLTNRRNNLKGDPSARSKFEPCRS
jgi:hypothetical protein